MIDRERYVAFSLELHLFFARIMKEHSLFLKAAFTPVNSRFAAEAEFFRQEFERLLRSAVALGDGIIDCRLVNSGELVTEFTQSAERQTEAFTGIPIDSEITAAESRLRCGRSIRVTPALIAQIRRLNLTALRLLRGLIRLKMRTLNGVVECRMFTMNYPLLLEHILREARLYQTFVRSAENGSLSGQTMREAEVFWNRIMMEHAMFIRGLLDPTENDLINTADDFANEYATLLARAKEVNDETLIGRESLKETMKFRDFKTAGVEGIEDCKIRSVILPLLADHVLREANHYIRILSE